MKKSSKKSTEKTRAVEPKATLAKRTKLALQVVNGEITEVQAVERLQAMGYKCKSQGSARTTLGCALFVAARRGDVKVRAAA